MSDENVVTEFPTDVEPEIPEFIQLKLDILDDLAETDEFLEADSVVIAYSIGDYTFVREYGTATGVRGTVEYAKDFLTGQGRVGSAFDEICDECGEFCESSD